MRRSRVNPNPFERDASSIIEAIDKAISSIEEAKKEKEEVMVVKGEGDPVDVYRSEKGIAIHVFVPRLDKKESSVTYDPEEKAFDLDLVMRDPGFDDAEVVYRGIPVGKAHVKIEVPASIDEDNVSVSYREGILMIEAPVVKEAESKVNIPIS